MTHATRTEVRNELVKLINLLDVGTPSNFPAVVNTLQSAGAKLSRLSEVACNGVFDRATGFMRWNDEDQATNDRQRDEQEQRATMALESLFDAATCARLDVEFQGDPRGPSIIIGVKGGQSRVVTLY